MGFDAFELKTSILSKALSRSHVNMICVLYLLSSISLSSGCSGNLHGFEDADLTGWQDCGGSSWYIDPAKGHESRSSLRSGPIECTGISRICREVQGPAEVTFWWQCGPLRQGIGELSFMVDDTRHVCSSAEWSPISYTVRDNKTHQMTWEYRKIKCYPKDAGGGWIDDLCISSWTPSTPSEVKLENISTTSTDNASSGTRVMSSGCIIEFYNLTIITDQINMKPNNVTINPTGDVLIRPKEVNISPDRITMNTSYVDIHSEAISVEAKGYTNLIVNTSLNTTTSALPATQSINVTIDSIASPLKMIPLRTDLPPSISLLWPNESSKFFVGTPISFRFKPVDDGTITKCSLYINNCRKVDSSDIINNNGEEEHLLNYSFNGPGSYKWHVVCEDESHQSNTSDKWSISIRPETVYVDKNMSEGLDEESGRWYYNDIQKAIDDVVEGTTIIVEPGNYEENLFINKRILIRGNLTQYGLKPKILGASRNGINNIVNITSSDVSLSEIELDKSPEKCPDYGISINNKKLVCSNISITNMSITNFRYYGIKVENTTNLTLFNNTIKGNGNSDDEAGICIIDSEEFYLIENNITNVGIGIEAWNSRELTIKNNYINHKLIGICIKDNSKIIPDPCNFLMNTFSPDGINNCGDSCQKA